VAIGDDWSIDYVNRRITYVGSGTRYTANELYSWLMDVFDEPEQMDDPIPMTAQTPTDYTLVNGWFINYESFKYIYNGAIKTDGWDADTYDYGIVLIEFEESGYTDAVASDIGKTVTGSTTGDFGTLLAYDNTNRRWWVRVSTAGTYASAGETVSVSGGTGSGTASAVKTGEYLWTNLYTLGSINDDAMIYIYYGTYQFSDGYYPQGDEIEPFWLKLTGTGHIDVLVLIKEAGTTIQSGYITVFIRNYGYTQDWFEVDLSSGGRNAVPLSTSTDISNQSLPSVVNDNTDIQIVQVNGKLNVTGESGTFQDWETITGGTSGATAIVLEYDADSHYLILGQVEGTFQDGETITGSTSGATATVNGTLDTSVQVAYKDLNNGNGPRPYNTLINLNGHTLAEMYEYMKYITSYQYFWPDYVLFYDASSGTYTDYSSEARDYNTAESSTIDDVPLPPQQATTSGDAIYVGSPDQFNKVAFLITTPGDYSDISLGIEYWNGSAWTTLTTTSDDTNGFKNDNVREITFDPPGDWATTDVNGTTAYWIRIVASNGASPSITTAPKASEVWVDFPDEWYVIQVQDTTLYKVYGWYYKYAFTSFLPVKAAPWGQYLGGTFFGARGVWIENYDSADAKNFQLIDADGVTQNPPNVVSVKVTSVASGDRVAVFRLTAAGGDINKQRYQLGYIHPEYVYFYNANSDSYTDETEDASESTADDVYLPPQQTTTEGDAIYFGDSHKFNTVRINVTTAGSYSDITIVWEYWDGSAWTTLSVTDNTNGFTTAGTNEVTFTPPGDWAKTSVNGTTAYWIRARATFGASPSITTAPLAGEAWHWFNYSGSGIIAVSTQIAGDEPFSGIVRIVQSDGTDHRYAYQNYSGYKFILDTGVTLSQDYSEGQYVYVPIIDEVATSSSVSTTLIYSSDIPVLVRVRQKGIIPFEVESTVTNVGLSVSAIRTTDNIVT